VGSCEIIPKRAFLCTVTYWNYWCSILWKSIISQLLDGGCPALTRRSARLVTSDVCGPRGVWLLSTGSVGRGRPRERVMHFYSWPPVNKAHIASRVPVVLYPRVMKHFPHAAGHSRRNCPLLPSLSFHFTHFAILVASSCLTKTISLRPAWCVAALD
jgi:hypothetical protein